MALLTDAYGGYGGIAKFNRDLLEGLAEDGRFESILALPRLRPARELKELPAAVHYRVPARDSRWKFSLDALRTTWQNRPLDLLLCGHIRLLPVARMCLAISRAPLVLVVHGIDAWQAPGPRFPRWMQSLDAVFSVSLYTAERLREWAPIAPEHCHILPNVIDLERFSPGSPPPALAERLGLRGKKVLLTVGRLDTRERMKGYDEAIQVLSRLRSRFPELVYLVVGEGDDRARLEALAHRLDVADRVIFSGYVSESEKPDYYRLADVYVMPSSSEGFGIAYLEALACGLPVIGGLHGGGTEVLRGMERAVAIPPGDCAALEQAIPKMLALGTGAVPGRLADYTVDRFRERLGRYLDLVVGQ